MAILYTQIVRLSDKRVLVSSESPFTRNFENTYPNILRDMQYVAGTFENETQFCSGSSSSENILLYFKRFGAVLFISAVELGLSRTSVSLYFEKLSEKFVQAYGTDVGGGGSVYIKFEDVIRDESKAYSRDRGMAETNEILQAAKEVCVKNYTNVIQRGHKIDQLEQLGYKLQGVSEKFRKKSRRMHIEALTGQYVFYLGLALFVFLVLYFFLR